MEQEPSFMEQIIEKLKKFHNRTYQASNGISFFLGDDGEVWYITPTGMPFTINTIQVAREEFLFG